VAGSSTQDTPTKNLQASRHRPVDFGLGTSIARIRSAACAAETALASARAATVGLALCGVALQVALFKGWYGAFSLGGHPGFPPLDQDPIVWFLDRGDTGMVRFLLLLAAIAVPYVLGLALALRAKHLPGLVIAFAGAVVFGFTMLALFPAGALDIFHNILDGRLVWMYHLNPIVVPPSAVSTDPLFPYLHYWWNTTTAYGPLWFLVTFPAYLFSGDGLIRNIVAYKALPFAFELATLVFIALIVSRIAPRRVAAAVVCFGWNPLVLWEIAGNGHNDIVMMFFAIAAIFALLTARWPLAFPLLVCSILVKYVTVILLPIFLFWVLLRHGRRAMLPLVGGLALALLVSLVIVAHFWVGRATISPLREQQNYFIFSPASALIGSGGELLSNTFKVAEVKHGLTLTFLVLYALVLARVRPNPVSLIQASVMAVFFFLVLMTWWFWPWYVIWGIALASLLPGTFYSRLFVLFSFAAMLLYLTSSWYVQLWNYDTPLAMPLGNMLLVFLPPIMYAAVHLIGAGESPGDSELPSVQTSSL
jgi:hypothetical protein